MGMRFLVQFLKRGSALFFNCAINKACFKELLKLQKSETNDCRSVVWRIMQNVGHGGLIQIC